MKIGSLVKFIDGLYPDEEGSVYRVIEINGDRAVIEFICDLPFPPQSVALVSELLPVSSPPQNTSNDHGLSLAPIHNGILDKEKQWLKENGWASWEALHSALLDGKNKVIDVKE